VSAVRTYVIAALLVLANLTLPAAGTASERDPTDASRPKAPDGTPICADWVHDRHAVTVNGRRYATWHPARDARYGCAFGHEHGSNPRAFRHLGKAGRIAFGRVAAHAGVDEAHAGFKLFVTNDDRKGLAWMVLLHQGTGSPKRGSVRFHSLEAWLVRRATRRRRAQLAARVRLMADFGPAVANCPGERRLARMRWLPHPACRSAYEEWATQLDVGGVFRASPAFGVQNAITQFDPGRPQAAIFNKRCGRGDPAGWRSRCKGDRRTLLTPQWWLRNPGPARFHTDAFGRPAASGLPQFVSNGLRVNQNGEDRGIENAFVMERPSDGGLYRSGRGRRSAGFEFPGYCVLGAN
jgi:hypothetical protein